MRRNIFLIGLMGVGKTTIGKLIANELDLDFYDSDQEIEKRTGVNIPWIFELESEQGFRRREAQAIDELTRLEGIVLATGGGVVLSSENRKALASRGVVIYLHATVVQLTERTSRNQNRPLLAQGNPGEILEKLLLQREPLYREIADFVYETSNRSVAEVAQQIAQDLKEKKYF